MIATRFKSSNLRAASYNPFSAKLTVVFHSDSVYEYSRVPAVAYWRLVQADSHGSYFASHIRDQYPVRKLK